MKNSACRLALAVLLYLSSAPATHGQEIVQPRPRHGGRVSLSAPQTTRPGIELTLAEWWGRHKLALQYLSACTLASASLSYAVIVGIGNPLGGAVLGLLGAAIMVAICL